MWTSFVRSVLTELIFPSTSLSANWLLHAKWSSLMRNFHPFTTICVLKWQLLHIKQIRKHFKSSPPNWDSHDNYACLFDTITCSKGAWQGVIKQAKLSWQLCLLYDTISRSKGASIAELVGEVMCICRRNKSPVKWNDACFMTPYHARNQPTSLIWKGERWCKRGSVRIPRARTWSRTIEGKEGKDKKKLRGHSPTTSKLNTGAGWANFWSKEGGCVNLALTKSRKSNWSHLCMVPNFSSVYAKLAYKYQRQAWFS